VKLNDNELILTHGDFGYHNMLITEDGMIKVIDWEFAELIIHSMILPVYFSGRIFTLKRMRKNAVNILLMLTQKTCLLGMMNYSCHFVFIKYYLL
ncbi:MAG: phosphotransferase, partial [Clostridiaceae bacterium]|nr:phosphotransferase [Clostridiaceae bacterium]